MIVIIWATAVGELISLSNGVSATALSVKLSLQLGGRLPKSYALAGSSER